MRGAMLLLVACAAAALAMVGWGAWRLERGESLPDWLARLAVVGGLMSGERLAQTAREADERAVANAIWRNEAANRVRAETDVRAVAWDGDRLLVLLAPGSDPSGGRAAAVCAALSGPGELAPVRVRLETVDGRGDPVEAWCGHRNR